MLEVTQQRRQQRLTINNQNSVSLRKHWSGRYYWAFNDQLKRHFSKYKIAKYNQLILI